MIFVLTGAGLSAESGLGTFRDEGGLWTQYDLSEVATPEGFAADPEKVLAFYNARRANADSATPNAAHTALARLSQQTQTALVTQNVDSLLEAAGARDVIHMHGQLDWALCAGCGARWDAPAVMQVSDPCPACAAKATRPDVVWFGEMPYHMDRIENALSAADLFVAIGTSGTVYPAAGFVEMARAYGIETLELNLEPSGGRFDDGLYGPATDIVPDWVDRVLTA
ncbi:NAD-dependent protein deacylase [Rhodobacteraceae bacterium THAF1]|uniref:NAD-dependent deacylase n=1 Tax=Palleronia sp. THAF1 TaxID=2587842 RepID=UPI000F4065BC|nr:NAD-dependent deacylase [Palleronia sp. THAF1]QFU09429.1 NAD-dependent protein deacylase [Palleronia sp. THAF1]VDC21927.1 NAD-dependent protein deacylase [Rhodobacteraceae bacterium THAF1]